MLPSLDPEDGMTLLRRMVHLAHEQKALRGLLPSAKKLTSSVYKLVDVVLECKLQDIIPGIDGACFALSIDRRSINMETLSSDDNDLITVGEGLYLEVLGMTPVCGDFNCEILSEGRSMVVKAVMAIPNFAELNDVSEEADDFRSSYGERVNG